MPEAGALFALALVAGAGAQLIDGALGMGFGVVSASLLLAVGLPPVAVVATVNGAKILAGLFAGLAHWQAGNVRRDWLLPLGGAGVLGAVVGARLLVSLPSEQVRAWMGLVLAGMGLLLVWRSLAPAAASAGAPGIGEPRWRVPRRVGLGALGLLAGFLNALSGAYGPVATSAAMLASQTAPARIVGTVTVAEVVVAGAVTASILSGAGLHPASWELMLALTLGGTITAPIAAQVCRRLPPRVLVFCVGLALIGLNVGLAVSRFR